MSESALIFLDQYSRSEPADDKKLLELSHASIPVLTECVTVSPTFLDNPMDIPGGIHVWSREKALHWVRSLLPQDFWIYQQVRHCFI